MKHEKLTHPSQIALRERHANLLADIELVAQRANDARKAPREHAADILEAAETALVRVTHEWRASRGGNQNNLFFDPLSKRLRRIVRFYRGYCEATAAFAPAGPGKSWVYKITNYERIPFDRLKPWFRASHVDEALKMGITLGLRELPGVLIYEEVTND
jgi:hypothetical protein